MSKIYLSFLFVFYFFTFSLAGRVVAVYEPNSQPNNRFGIHIISEADLDNAAKLVNSNGGQWGYVTMVITEDERQLDRWQAVFRQLNRLKLIPIIRLATKAENNHWKKPELNQAPVWAEFLNQLPWPTQNRYVVLFNEPNHSKEWGQEINPEEYAEILVEYSKKLKNSSDQFFILPAGLDASASNQSTITMDEVVFLNRMLSSRPDVFNYIDGWTSHSYPQPNFQGPATNQGRGTIKTFDWELSLLKQLGVNKTLPVFITETGWNQQNLTEENLNSYYQIAFKTAWSDQRIIAVTPFLLNYQSEPFTNFSWQVLGTTDFYPHYYQVQNLPKISGSPCQDHQAEIIGQIPSDLIIESNYEFILKIKNTGQSIINQNDKFLFKFKTVPELKIKTSPLPVIEPLQNGQVNLELNGPAEKQSIQLEYWLEKDKQIISPVQRQTITFHRLLSLRGFMVWLKLLE